MSDSAVDCNAPPMLASVMRRDETALFCMCNPPFFGSNRAKARRARRGFRAKAGEVVTDGGEVTFIGKLIDESLQLRQRVCIYSSMVGCERSLRVLQQRLTESSDVESHGVAMLCQGKTFRHVLWWKVVATAAETR